MLDEWAAKDPIARYRRDLVAGGVATTNELDEIDAMSRSYAAEEAQLAEEAPMPDPATVTRGVYAGEDFTVPRLELVKSPFATKSSR
jgi:TPP-dependent pyruvate/acetoin dehydrogenase alpha subunit